jgi:chemotaxis protein MotB
VKPRYFQADHAGRDRWMISYLDVLTILLIFFVAIAAKSLESPPPPAAEPRHALLGVQRRLEQHGLDLELQPRGLVISLPQAILFPPGEDRINAAAVPIVEQIAEVLREVPNRISLAGHADATPIHNRRFRNNWELAAARSLRLLELLSERYGIDESRLSVASYGSLDPRTANDTPEGRAGNRRVEIVILDEGR